MAENNLEAKITLDVTDLKKGLSEAKKAQTDYEKSISETQEAINENRKISAQYEKAIKELTEAHEKSYISTTKYTKALEKLQKDSKETAVETADLNKKLQSLQSGANSVETKVAASAKTMASTTTTATQLGKSIGQVSTSSSRAGTSVTTLLTRFSSLQNSTGSTSSAVKALAGSFAGPAGLAFAVSALIPILEKYGSQLLDISNYTTTAAKAQKQLAIESASEQANAQARLATLDSLLAVARDVTLSDEERTRAMAKINDEYSGLLPNLTLENINKEEVVKATDRLSKSLIREAKIRGAQNLIAKETEKMLLAQAKSALENADAIDYTVALLTSGGNGYQAFSSIIEKGAENQAKEIDKANKNIIEYKKLLDSLIGEDIAEGGTFSSTKPEKATKTKSPKVSQAEKDAETIRKINAQIFKDELADAKEAAKVQGGEVAQVLFQETGKLPSPELFIDIDSEDAFRKITAVENKLKELKGKVSSEQFDALQGLNLEQLTAYQNALIKFNEEAKLSAQMAGQAIGTVSGALAGALKTDSDLINTVSKVIIDASANMLQKLVADAIAGSAAKKASTATDIATDTAASTSNAIVAGTETASTMGPAAAFMMPVLIGAMLALVASSFSKVKFAQGGIVPGGSFSGDKIPAMLNSGEMVLNSGQQANLFKTLDGSLSSLQGQSNNNPMVASTVIRGEDIYVSWKRTSSNRQRFLG